MNIQLEIDEGLGLPVPRTRNYYTTRCNVQRTDIFTMAKKTEIWIVFWGVKVKNVDHGILTSSYSVAFESSMIGSMKDLRYHIPFDESGPGGMKATELT
jgi:hypothetical protein